MPPRVAKAEYLHPFGKDLDLVRRAEHDAQIVRCRRSRARAAGSASRTGTVSVAGSA